LQNDTDFILRRFYLEVDLKMLKYNTTHFKIRIFYRYKNLLSFSRALKNAKKMLKMMDFIFDLQANFSVQKSM